MYIVRMIDEVGDVNYYAGGNDDEIALLRQEIAEEDSMHDEPQIDYCVMPENWISLRKPVDATK